MFIHSEQVSSDGSSRFLLDVSAFFLHRVRWSYYPGSAELVCWALGESGERAARAPSVHQRARSASAPPVDYERSDLARRASSKIRRVCMSNSLCDLWTLTFREVPDFADLSRLFELFLRRSVRRGLVPGPYVWVVEYGSLNGRLHLHVASSWSLQGFVEVCFKCAGDVLRSKRSLPETSRCLGCCWGLGFVGAPSKVGARDPATVSRYLSKYLSKSEDLPSGVHRYRVAKGYQPVRVVGVGVPPCATVRLVREMPGLTWYGGCE